MDQKEIQYLIILVSLAFFSILVLLISLMFYISKRKAQYLIEKEKSKMKFEKEMVEARVEITEQNMKNLGRELHDNIGQLLTVAGLELEMLAREHSLSKKEIFGLKDAVKKSLDQVRGMSKTLNSDVILNVGLVEAIENEVERLRRLDLINVDFTYPKVIEIDQQKTIVVFRMVQEFISNTLKHSEAKNLIISIEKSGSSFLLEVEDDGKGFDVSKEKQNSGLVNLSSRAKMISAEYRLDSDLTRGTKMSILIKQ